MKHQNIPDLPRSGLPTVFGAFGIAAGLFLIIPLAQITSNLTKPQKEPILQGATVNPPAEPPTLVEPKIEETKKKLPKLTKPKEPKIPFTQLDVGITGGVPIAGPALDDILPTTPEFSFYDPGEVDKQPEPIEQIAPKIRTLPRETITVSVEFIVNEYGRVTHFKILRSGGERIDKAVREAVSRWRFKPGQVANENVRTRIRQNFEIGGR